MNSVINLRNISVALSATAVVFVAMLVVVPEVTGTSIFNAFVAEACCGDGDGDADGDIGVPKKCITFTANPSQLPAGGGTVTLTWQISGALSATISNGVGTVGPSGTRNVTVSDDTSWTLSISGGNGCSASVTVPDPEPEPPKCESFTASRHSVPFGGGDVTLTWDTTNADSVFIDNGVGSVSEDGSTNVFVSSKTTYTLTVSNADGEDWCEVTIKVDPEQKVTSCDSFTVSPTSLPHGGGQVTLTWATTNANSVSIDNGVGTVAADGSTSVNVTQTTVFTLTADGTNNDDHCTAKVVVKPKTPMAECDYFAVNPTSLPYGGGTVTLEWYTTNADSVFIDNGVGYVAEDGTKSVTVTDTTVFTLTVEGTYNSDTCTAKVVVKPDTPAAKCDYFTATPTSLPYGGGKVTLSWETTNADSVSLYSGSDYVEILSDDGTKEVNVYDDTTFTLTVHGTYGDDECTAYVDVEKKHDDLRCDYFNVSDSKVDSGDTVTLSWETTGATSASISPDIGSVGVDGSRDVTINNDVTYTLTINNGNSSKTCSVSIEEDDGGGGGGGGGGSSRPRCELEISDYKIKRGEEVELTWETSRARDIRIEDNHGNVLIDTDDLLNKDKKEFFDGELTVSPTEDTTYTLIAEHSRRDRECEVDVEVEDDIEVYEFREQQPLVAGVYLTQVPYTGFEAGPMLTTIFYALLTLWALVVAYILVIRRDSILGFSLAGAHDHVSFTDVSTTEVEPLHISEAEEYVQSTMTEVIPANLPVAPTAAPVIGYAALQSDEEVDILTALENRAHTQNVLLSSDAMRFFAGSVATDEHMNTLDAVVARAKAAFPSEDGWVVINLSRMESLLAEAQQEPAMVLEEAPVAPMTAGSLAEAIVSGNLAAALAMTESRPMVALADAAADLDAVYRLRKGESATISDLLATETAKLSDEQLLTVIKALTSALDGTYTDEASAVKMAVMKAVKVVA